MPPSDLPAAVAQARVVHDRLVTAAYDLLLACDDVDALDGSSLGCADSAGAAAGLDSTPARHWRDPADRALELATANQQPAPGAGLLAGGRSGEREDGDASGGLGHLGDRAVRSAFLAGLQLQSLLTVTSGPARSRLENVVDSLDALIREVRRVVYGIEA